MEYKLLNISTQKFGFINKAKAGKDYELNPRFGKGVNKVNESLYELHLVFSLHDNGEKEAPYDIDLEVVGLFQLKDCDDNEINDFMNANAVSILFPYLRSVLSTSMTSMMVSPIVLPIVDAKVLFKNNN